MKREEINKTKGKLVEKDMVLIEGYILVWQNREIVFRKEGTKKMVFFFCVCVISNEKG